MLKSPPQKIVLTGSEYEKKNCDQKLRQTHLKHFKSSRSGAGGDSVETENLKPPPYTFHRLMSYNYIFQLTICTYEGRLHCVCVNVMRTQCCVQRTTSLFILLAILYKVPQRYLPIWLMLLIVSVVFGTTTILIIGSSISWTLCTFVFSSWLYSQGFVKRDGFKQPSPGS